MDGEDGYENALVWVTDDPETPAVGRKTLRKALSDAVLQRVTYADSVIVHEGLAKAGRQHTIALTDTALFLWRPGKEDSLERFPLVAIFSIQYAGSNQSGGARAAATDDDDGGGGGGGGGGVGGEMAIELAFAGQWLDEDRRRHQRRRQSTMDSQPLSGLVSTQGRDPTARPVSAIGTLGSIETGEVGRVVGDDDLMIRFASVTGPYSAWMWMWM